MSNQTFWRIRPPISNPSRPKNPKLYVSKVKSAYNISSTVQFLWDPPIWNGFPKGYKVFCSSINGATNPVRVYYVNGQEIGPDLPMYSIENLPNDITIYCQVIENYFYSYDFCNIITLCYLLDI